MPRYRRRLRSRIIITFVLLGTGLTALFAVATLLLRAKVEDQLVDAWLLQEAANFVQFKRENPSPEAQFVFSRQIEIFVRSPRTLANLPFAWQQLPTGVHSFSDKADDGTVRYYKLAVQRDPDIISFLRWDYTQETLTARTLMIALIGAVFAFSLLALALGIWSSRRVMQPVSDLASRLQSFAQDAQPEPLAPHFAEDEVGQLAAALDEYADRLTSLVRRDREFNADVSHELRTPLAVIRGATELLQAQPGLGDKAAMRLKRIERAAAQSSDLIEALLTLSRAERGHGAADVGRIVDQIVEAQRLALRDKPVELHVQCGETVVVDCPDSVLSVALGNLIGNAVKYTREGTVDIRILADRVEIADSGPGISEDEAGHLFERGYRGKGAEGSKGAGIGLAIVSRLCALYRWSVWIAPGAERGAVATLKYRG
ncbi:MAG: HAMP domain-containing histidine kinase [Xanthomonadales bacterium]|nr:HAMP domain-containing histidine kinase [Xanthomonadales bacterium]